MRTNHLLLALFFTACATSDGFISENAHNCEAGQQVEIQVGFDPASGSVSERIDGQYTLIVEVANNSNAEITVKAVRADPMIADRNATVELQSGHREFDKTIAEGDASLFEIPITVRHRQVNPRDVDPRSELGTVMADLTVSVELSDGDSYRCRFRVPLQL